MKNSFSIHIILINFLHKEKNYNEINDDNINFDQACYIYIHLITVILLI